MAPEADAAGTFPPAFLLTSGMAEHRRVEPRGIVGTGMATDPERIRDVEDEHERRARAWRSPPERGFGDVLAEAPARGALEDDATDDREGQRQRGRRSPASASADAAAGDEEGERAGDGAAAGATGKGSPSASSSSRSSSASSKPLPRVPPDPREAMLRRQLEAPPRGRGSARSAETPPTGKARKPT